MSRDPATLSGFVAALTARNCNPRKNGTGWASRCPAHEDRKPSLTFASGDRQPVVMTCQAGCSREAILDALGLSWGDICEDREPERKPTKKIVATYDYTDENGTLLYQVVRYEPKDFRQRRPDGDGGWAWNMKDVPRVLYRLPAVLAAVADGGTVYVVEGEKDADAVNALEGRHVATCCVGGAGKWRLPLSESLRGAWVVIVADNDEPGLDHAREVQAKLSGIAASTEIVRAASGKDAFDHLAAGHGLADFVPIDQPEPIRANPEPVLEAPDSIPPIPEECWRGAFAAYRHALAQTTEAADALHFGVFLVTAGLVVGRRAYYRAGFQLYPTFYCALIGPTATGRKTTAKRRGDELRAEVGVEVSALSTASYEGLIDELAESEGRKVLLTPGEFRTLAAKARQDGGAAIIPGLTDLYDCPNELRHKTRGKHAEVVRPFVACLTASTVEWFREGFERTAVEGGFMNRWTFFDGTPKPPMPFPEAPDAASWGDTVQALQGVDTRLRMIPESDPLQVRLEAKARPLWAKAYEEHGNQRHTNELLGKMAERLPDQALKLATIYALLEFSDEIHEDQLSAALAFLAWQRECHRRIFSGFGDNDRKRTEDRILKRLSKCHAAGEKPTRRKLQQSFGSKLSAEDFNRSLRALIEAELVSVDRETSTVVLCR